MELRVHCIKRGRQLGPSPGDLIFVSVTCTVHCPFPSQWPGFLSALEPQARIKGVNRAGHRWENWPGQLPLCLMSGVNPVTSPRSHCWPHYRSLNWETNCWGKEWWLCSRVCRPRLLMHIPKSHLAWVRLQASFILKGEEAKSNISWFWSGARGDMLISSSLKGTLFKSFPTVPPLSGSSDG